MVCDLKFSYVLILFVWMCANHFSSTKGMENFTQEITLGVGETIGDMLQTITGELDTLMHECSCVIRELICGGNLRVLETVSVSASASRQIRGPENACLDNVKTKNGSLGFWTSNSNQGEWIQADLGQQYLIQSIVTQGRTDIDVQQRAHNRKWVTSYKIAYSNSGSDWAIVSDENTGNETIFKGNFDFDTKVYNNMPRGLEARFIRLIVHTWERMITMRWGIMGCSMI